MLLWRSVNKKPDACTRPGLEVSGSGPAGLSHQHILQVANCRLPHLITHLEPFDDGNKLLAALGYEKFIVCLAPDRERLLGALHFRFSSETACGEHMPSQDQVVVPAEVYVRIYLQGEPL